MRSWFVLFLSLLVMAGSLIPCCPADNCQDESSINMTCDPDEERETGTCSPFFTCGTCAGFVQQVRMVSVTAIKNVPPIHQVRPIHSISNTYLPSLFQPPRYS